MIIIRYKLVLTAYNRDIVAIHGICYDAPNMNFTTDVMGAITDWVEDDIGGIVMCMHDTIIHTLIASNVTQ